MDNKKYFSCVLSLFCLIMIMGTGKIQAQEDAISKYFSKYMDQKEFTSIYISPRMFNLMGANKKNSDNPEMEKTISRLSGLRMLSADSTDGVALYKEIFNKLNRESYEELMSVREPDSDVKFLIKSTSENKVSELLMLVGGKNNFFMLSIVGVNLDLNSVIEIAEDLSPTENEEEKE